MTNSITRAELKKTERSLKRVAVQQGVSLDEVRESIKEAIAAAMANPDPVARSRWAAAPFGDKVPSPEEFVAWCAREVGQRTGH